jgi:TonB-dependent SusC/RagA subfamily outer membrane receptor
MSPAHARQLLGLLLGCVTACSHQPSVGGETRTAGLAPVAALPASELTTEEIQSVPGQEIEQLLIRRIPGVLVSRTIQGGIAAQIHGVGSFFAGNDALFVVDGVPLQLEDGATLRAINPHDITSIQVVKDPVGMAMYGVRGSNGVIVISTSPR